MTFIKNRFLTWFPILTALLVLSVACGSQGSPDIEVTDVWLRPVEIGNGSPMAMESEGGENQMAMEMSEMEVTGAVYMTLVNNTDLDTRLVSVSNLLYESGGEVAESAELHESKMEDGIMSMQMLSNGISIPANQSVSLEPGGMHVMLFGLKDDLTVNDRVSLTLNFESSESQTVIGVVEQR